MFAQYITLWQYCQQIGTQHIPEKCTTRDAREDIYQQDSLDKHKPHTEDKHKCTLNGVWNKHTETRYLLSLICFVIYKYWRFCNKNLYEKSINSIKLVIFSELKYEKLVLNMLKQEKTENMWNRINVKMVTKTY